MTSDDRNREQGGEGDRKPGQDDGDVQSDPRRTREQHDEAGERKPPMREDVRQDDTPKAG